MHAPIAHKLVIAAWCAALVCISACTHAPVPLAEQLQSFHEFKLRNGVRVVVRQNPLSRMHSIVLNIKGGVGAVAPDKAGLDTIALQLMCSASERYTDTERRDLLKRTSSAIQARCDLDFATVQLQTIDTYFTDTFDLFLDLIMRPAFPQNLFRELVTNAVNAYRSELTDGYARASRAANQAFFREHPYQAFLQTPATLSSITMQDVQDFYRRTMVAQRLTIFASGNFNLDALQERLNATIGTLPGGDAAPAVPSRFKHSGRARLLLDSAANLSPGAAYLRGNLAIVPPDHADYYALELAGKVLSDIMNDLLRTRNALVYSAWAGMFNKKANYGNLSAYRTSDPLKTIELITAAIDVAAQGKCVSPYSQKEVPGTYIDIDRALGFYKVSFSTEYFSGIQENAAVALSMAAAHNTHGDCRQFLTGTDMVNRVSTDDIVRVVKRYLKKGRITWALSAHPDTLAAVKKKSAALSAYEIVTLP
jgi:zinc protease